MTRSIFFSALLLFGCATNTIRLDRAATMTAAGRTATGATRAFINKVGAENRESLIDLAAADPNCQLPSPLIASGNSQGLCRSGDAQSNDFRYPRITARDLQPSLAVIDGVTAYLDAVDAILTREPIDYAGPAADAQASSVASAVRVEGRSPVTRDSTTWMRPSRARSERTPRRAAAVIFWGVRWS